MHLTTASRSTWRWSCACARHEGILRYGDVVPLTSNLGIRWRCRQLHVLAVLAPGKEPAALNGIGSWVVPNIGAVWFVEEKTSCSCRWRGGGSSYDSYVIRPFAAWIVGDALRRPANLWHPERFPWLAAFTAVHCFYFFRPTSVSSLWRICVYIYTHTYLTA
jgi:hypothetical protein